MSSAPGKGSVFRFNIWLGLPLVDQPEVLKRAFPVVYQATILTSNINMAAMIRRHCAILGWPSMVVDHYNTLPEVVKGENNQSKMRAILIDEAFMASSNGSDKILQWLQSERDNASISLLMVSHNRQGFGEESLQLHDGVVVKPFTPYSLYDAVLNAAGTERPSQYSSPSLQQAPSGHLLAGLRVLLVEDNTVNQMIAKAMLEAEQAVVILANNGQEAVDRIEHSFADIDLVLMDMRMPVMDGVEATQQLRQSYTAQQLPIVALTANSTDEDRERCLMAGMQDFISKPFDAERLIGLVRRYAIGQNR